MANHRYTSLTELLDSPKTREPIVSNGSGYDSDDHSFTTEMFGELYFRERSSLSPTKTNVWDLFNPPLPPPRHLHDHAMAEVEGLKEAAAHDDPDKAPVLDQKNGKKTGKGKAKLTEKKCCKYDNSGKLFPPPISTLKMNRAGKPLIYHEFDTGKTGFVPKLIFLRSHEIMAATSGSGGRPQRMLSPRDHEEEKEPAKATDDEAEQQVPPNGVKAAGNNNNNKKQV